MIEANKKKSEGVDEATPTDLNKKCPSRASSERAKKRLKLVLTNYSDSFTTVCHKNRKMEKPEAN